MKTFQERIIILDFGAQYSQLIARRVREAGVYSEIYPFNIELEKLADLKPKGIILSGGPSSVYAEDAPHCDRRIFELDVPILGICYGLQLMAYFFNGQVDSAAKREFGRSEITINNSSDLFADLDTNLTVWMSHGDKLDKLPDDFESIAHTDNAPVAAARHKNQPWYGVQFHPEVAHTPRGFDILKNFVFQICRCEGGWNASSFVESTVENVQQQVGDGKVVCGLSGGVDSSVAAVLIHKAIGEHLTCIFVDNGLLRKGEVEQVVNTFQNHFHIPLIHVDASKQFLSALRGVIDPEEKRKIIGKVFIDVFESEAKKIEDAKFLAQGTLYPDLIESVSFKGPSATIKSHHNVGGLPEKMNLELVEPLRELFKDEVRKVGHELEIPSEVLNRHPFPGPGLAIRIMGDVTEDKLAILRETDAIFIEELRSQNLYDSVWQALTVLLPVQTVGVMGDERTYENVVALRAVTSLDGMTADWAHLPHEFLSYVSNRIINEIRGINRVVYDISSKPPSTIEWE